MMKFPDKYYAGFQARKTDCNLGFITPYGEDAAAKKRMATVDNWAKGYSWNRDKEEAIPSVIYDNVPMEGFEVRHSVNHSSSWNSCRDKWRILDPRGFELEITSGNLEQIIGLTSILHGKIVGECIWAREGANNYLVPVNSELYTQAVQNTELSKKKASIRDAKPYDKVTLVDGKELYYMGYFYPIVRDYETFMPYIHKNKYHFFRKEINGKNYTAISSPKLAMIEPAQEWYQKRTPEQILKEMNVGGANFDASTLMVRGATMSKDTEIEAIMVPERTMADIDIMTSLSSAYVPVPYKDNLWYEISAYTLKDQHRKDKDIVSAYLLDWDTKEYLMGQAQRTWYTSYPHKMTEQIGRPKVFHMVDFNIKDEANDIEFRIKR